MSNHEVAQVVAVVLVVLGAVIGLAGLGGVFGQGRQNSWAVGAFLAVIGVVVWIAAG